MTWLRGGRPGVRVPARLENLSLLQHLQTGSGVHRVSYSVGIGALPGGKAAGACRWQLRTSAEVKNGWSCTSAPGICHHDLHGDNSDFFFYLYKVYINFLLLPTWYSNFLFIHTFYIKLNSSTCFEHNPHIIRRSTTHIVHMQPLVSSPVESDDTRGCICTICVVDLLMMGGLRSKHVEEFNFM